jgi:hypothetical protein
MLQVFLPCPAIYQKIIKEYQQKLPQLLFEYVIHAGLKGGWCVGQPKWHDQKLIMPIMASESSFGNILLSDSDLVVPRSKINLRKIHCSVQLIQKLVDPGNRVPVLDRLLIQCSIVNAHPHCAILLLHQHYRRSEWTRARPDVSHLQQFLNGLLNLILEFLWMPVGSGDHRFFSLFQFNSVLKSPVWWSP